MPLALLVALLAVFAFDKLLYLVVFLTPLSLPLSEVMPGLSFNMALPTEPLLFGILLIFILKCFAYKDFDREILTHPISFVIYFSVFWMLVTSISSSMPVVSFKYFLTRIWFIVAFYLLTANLFKKGRNIEKFIWMYTIPLIIVIAYTINRHLGYGLWDKQAANFVPNPFYNDHTAYGAALAMYIPFFFGFSFTPYFSVSIRNIGRIVLGILIAALILSYTRAAWLGMIAALTIWIFMRLKLRFKPIFIAFLIGLTVILVFQTQILMYLERNDTESSTNLSEHFSSMTNISSDASNLERINRWSCAIRMFEDKPVFGWGPGTYMFKYASYQLTADRTIISTNSADGGNAHSEYLGPLAESGIFGLVSVLMLISIVIYTGVHAYSRATDKRIKTILMSAILGLITYYIHGVLNNFLDTDKLSLPFWGFTAIIVALDIYTRKSIPEKTEPIVQK